MSVEICIECEDPVERTGEEALYIDGEGPFCEKCFDWRVLEEEHEAVVKELKAEIERLKEDAKLSPEITQKAERYTELCNIVKLSKGENRIQELEKVWQKWEQLKAGTYIPVEQALREKAELEAEIARLKALNKMSEGQEVEACHTWQEERAAVVAWLTKRHENTSYLDVVRIVIKQSAEMIERGEHWPEGGTP